MENDECRECALPIGEYKQNIQQDRDLCEFCFIAAQGSWDDENEPTEAE